MTPEPRAAEEPGTTSDVGESDVAAEAPTSQRPADAELEADLASDEDGSEATVESIHRVAAAGTCGTCGS